MRKHLSSFLSKTLLLLALFLTFGASAQEYVKTIELYKTERVIVRDSSYSQCYVYAHYNGSDNVFLEVSDIGTSAPMMELPSSVSLVNDFEIYNGTVYFCGVNTSGAAIMGRFSLQGFPSSSLYIWTVSSMALLSKMDVGFYNGKTHVVMTGKMTNGSSRIVDAWENASLQWNFAISTEVEDCTFDDVAILSNKVIVSARMAPNNNGTFFFFSYPPSILSTILTQNVYYKDVIQPIGTVSEVLIKPDTSNNFSFLRNTEHGPSIGECNAVTQTLSWHKFFGSSLLKSSCRGIDLSYNPLANRVDLVVDGFNNDISMIVHPHEPIAPPLNPVFNGHRYSDDEILSIDAINSGYGLFFAAGIIPNAVPNYLRLYRYKYNVWQNCMEYKTLSYSSPSRMKQADRIMITNNISVIMASCYVCSSGEMPIITECQQRTR